MAVSFEPDHPKATARRGRYTPDPSRAPGVISRRMLGLLQHIADLGILTTRQLALLSGLPTRLVARDLRQLFDGGLVRIIAVPRAALASAEAPNDARMLFGSAPNIITLSTRGQRLLFEHGLTASIRTMPNYGPKNSFFLAHELMLKDVRVWLACSARLTPDQELDRWSEGDAAAMALATQHPMRLARPDARFVYRFGQRVLVGLVEVDRETERGAKRWGEKLTKYEALFAGQRLREATGYQHARVLVVTLTARRRDRLTTLIASQAGPQLSKRFWVTTLDALSTPGLSAACWKQPGSHLSRPLLTEADLAGAGHSSPTAHR